MAASVAITVRERRVAVLLNRNAQGVRPSVLRRAAALIEARDLFVTGSREQAREAARAMIGRGAEVVCVGGGDGTFIQAAGDLLAEAAIAGCDPPMLLPLRLGSGNAIADVAGASANSARGLREDLARASRGGAGRVLRLLRVDEQPAHFAGAGMDAKLNEDFRDLIKQGIGRGRFGRVFHGLPGIVLSLVARTIPRLILDPPLRARVVNTGSHASRLGPDGLPSGAPFPEGAVLHEGPITIVAASTVTQYARGLTFFPFADRVGEAFQLRVSSAGAREVLPNLRSIFAGTYRNAEKVHDFSATSVRIELSESGPVHVGGDLWGHRRALSLTLDPRTVTLLGRG